MQRLALAHVYDLFAATLGATRDEAEIARGRGVRAARLRAIKQDIAEHLDEADLSVVTVAARHRCTRRYIHMLFEAEGTSFTEYVLGERLARAHRMLTDPLRATEKIATIAYDAGFGAPISTAHSVAAMARRPPMCAPGRGRTARACSPP